MNCYAAMFVSYLKEGGLQFRLEHTENSERIFINDDAIEIDESTCRFMRVLYKVSTDKMDDTLLLANQLNKDYSYVGFCVFARDPAVFCVSYYFSLYGSEKEVADQILKTYYVFNKSISEAFGK